MQFYNKDGDNIYYAIVIKFEKSLDIAGVQGAAPRRNCSLF